MDQAPQQAQHELVEQALADPRIAAAVQAYDAVRPYVPLATVVHVEASYAPSTTLTSALPRA